MSGNIEGIYCYANDCLHNDEDNNRCTFTLDIELDQTREGEAPECMTYEERS